MKQVMFVQTDICEDLCSVTAGLDQHLCAIKKPGGSKPATQVTEEAPIPVMDSARLLPGCTVVGTSATEEVSSDRSGDGETATTTWSRVVKRGHRQQLTGSTAQPKAKPNAPRREKRSGIVGTSAGGNILVVKTKLVVLLQNSPLM